MATPSPSTSKVSASIHPKRFVTEFREFISRGNVFDLAIGVIIGGAFGRIVTSLVEDVIMPPVGVLLGGVNFADFAWILVPARTVNGEEIPAVALRYGQFGQNLLNFLIIALTVFLAIKFLVALKARVIRQEEEAKEAKKKEEAKKEAEELRVLREIRNLLAQGQKKS